MHSFGGAECCWLFNRWDNHFLARHLRVDNNLLHGQAGITRLVDGLGQTLGILDALQHHMRGRAAGARALSKREKEGTVNNKNFSNR